jgi:hypothetical protein
MRTNLGGLLALCIAFGITACASGPNVHSELPLKRVVVYRNGVGYFERAGQVEDEAVHFQMRQRMVGDFLASLAVIEKGGSSVRSASFPLEVNDDTPAEPEPSLCPSPDGEFALRTSKCFASEERVEPKPKKPDPNALREVVLHLDGKEHDLLIGYLSETPVWRPSYRVVVEADGSAGLQAWGIVQNLSGEDWQDVSLSLVAGAPLAFQSTLGTPVVPERPVVTDQGEVMAVVPQGVTSLNQAAPKDVDRYSPESGYGAAANEAAAAPAMAEEAESYGYSLDDAPLDKRARLDSKKRAAGGAAPKMSMSKAAPAPMPPPPVMAPAPRRLSELAAVALEGGTTRYDMPFSVTIPKNSATMVLLTSQRVPGETVLLFAPEGGVPASASHPFRVARITNATPGMLERGPISVFERGSFLGQGLLEPLPPKATATVPFALERGVGVESERQSDQQGARLFRIAAGSIWLERDWVQRTTYRIENGADKPSKLLVKHSRISGARLFKPPADTEDNAGTGIALIPVPLKAHSKTELVVDERRANAQPNDWFDSLVTEAVKAYAADPRADKALVAALAEAWKTREQVTKGNDELARLEHEQSELESAAEQTRDNLRAIEKNNQALDLRQKLTKRLAETSARLDAIAKRSIEVRLLVDEQSVRFREAVRELKLDQPLQPSE